MDTPLVGNAPSVCKIRELVKVVSDTPFSVLVRGETGTGKEVVARLLHESSNRQGRFIKVNCAALPVNLLESELFGYERGAFTGADRMKPGKFELASNGVIFLDEIGDMPMALQAKLLEVLQSGKFVRLGGTAEVTVNTWVISSTHQDLQKQIRETVFREDLYYRLNIIQIELPPLRDRREDIPLLTRHLMEKHGRELKIPGAPVPEEMRRLFEIYHWPGNVRELSSTLLRLMVGEAPAAILSEMVSNMRNDGLSPSDEFQKGMFKIYGLQTNPDDGAAMAPSLLEIKAQAARVIERKAILYALNQTGWKKRAAARLLNISHKALYYKMEGLGIAKAIG